MAIELEERVAKLELESEKIWNYLAHANLEKCSLKEAFRKAIDLFRAGKKDEALSLLFHESRPIWMSDNEQKIFNETYDKHKDKGDVAVVDAYYRTLQSTDIISDIKNSCGV